MSSIHTIYIDQLPSIELQLGVNQILIKSDQKKVNVNRSTLTIGVDIWLPAKGSGYFQYWYRVNKNKKKCYDLLGFSQKRKEEIQENLKQLEAIGIATELNEVGFDS